MSGVCRTGPSGATYFNSFSLTFLVCHDLSHQLMLQFGFRSALTASLAIGRLECSGSTVNFCALASARRSLHCLYLQIQVQHLHVSPVVGLRYAIANKAAVSTEDSTFQNAAVSTEDLDNQWGA